MRLAKYLAHSGVASRRKAEQIIAHHNVTLGNMSSFGVRVTIMWRGGF